MTLAFWRTKIYAYRTKNKSTLIITDLQFRERPPDFFVQAYFVGPKNVNPQDTSTLWLKFEETLSKYEETKRY